MSKAAVFLAEGFEEIEGLTPVDLMRRAGISVTTVSIGDSLEVISSHGIAVKADALFDELEGFADFDLLVLPGGGEGTKNLENCGKLLDELEKADKNGKLIAAICAAPRILGKLGMLKGKQAVCYPGNEEFLQGALVHPEFKAVMDGRFITARGMGASIEFGAFLIEALEGKEKAEEILEKIRF